MTELLLPAGNLEKLKIALTYGADACYIGAKKYSLRAQASNFTKDDILEALSFAHERGKKVYITVNVIPREDEIDGIIPYLKELEEIRVDGIIVSSPIILYLAKTYTNLHVSLSTQMSSINTFSVKEFINSGVNRVVLGRELAIKEIIDIKKNTKAEIEVFIHGGMCSAYSGRCTLSNYMSNRDANRGGCAHSCRWNYDLFENNNKLNKNESFQISSKDLIGIEYIKDLVNAGIDSLKVEGRMKSLNYCATIAYTYRMLIDDISSNKLKDYNYYYNLLESCENRASYSGFLSGINNKNLTLYSKEQLNANQSFLAMVLSFDNEKMEALIEVRNHFNLKDKFLVMSPDNLLFDIEIYEIYKDGELVNEAKHALEKLVIKVNKPLNKDYIIRRK